MRAPCTALRPTGPSPKTATSEPWLHRRQRHRRAEPAPADTVQHGQVDRGRRSEDRDDRLFERHHVLGQAADVSCLHDLPAVGGRRDRYGFLTGDELAAIGATTQALVALAALRRDRDDHAVVDLHAPHLGPHGNDDPYAPVTLDGRFVRVVDDDRRLRAERIRRVLRPEHPGAHRVTALRNLGLDHDLAAADRQQRQIHQRRGAGAEAGRDQAAEFPASQGLARRAPRYRLRRHRSAADERRAAGDGCGRAVLQQSSSGDGHAAPDRRYSNANGIAE